MQENTEAKNDSNGDANLGVDSVVMNKLCGCGGKLRYTHSGNRMSCNKYAVCPTYDELFIKNRKLLGKLRSCETALEKIKNTKAKSYEYRAWAKEAIDS